MKAATFQVPFAPLHLPDLWQQDAVRHLKSGADVIIDAPTGAGKTRVFELFLKTPEAARLGQAVYTVPTRALANDKWHEWRALGWNAGIATGDIAENLHAPVLVATLETQRERILSGDVVMRYHSRNFPLLTPAGQAFDPLKGLRKLKVGEVREWPVRFVTGGKTREARLCAIRKSTEQAERTLRKIKLKTKGKFERVKPSTLEFAKYVVVVCTVPSGEMSAQLALEFYRARWQVELAFKRLKSLLMLGQLPKKRRSPARHGCRAKS